MNDRMRELMDQAVAFRLDPDSNAYEAQVHPEDLELFAELIVRACCDMVNRHIQHNNPNDCLLALDIKEHFGIEP